MTDTAKRLWLGVVNDAETTLYTVPAGATAIVRGIRVCNSSDSLVALRASVGPDSLATRIVPSGFLIPPHGDLDWSGFLVLEANETLRATAGAASALTATVSGVEVTA